MHRTNWVSYVSDEVFMLELVVENDKKCLYKNVEYNWYWGELREDDTVVLLRFIKQPFVIARCNEK